MNKAMGLPLFIFNSNAPYKKNKGAVLYVHSTTHSYSRLSLLPVVSNVRRVPPLLEACRVPQSRGSSLSSPASLTSLLRWWFRVFLSEAKTHSPRWVATPSSAVVFAQH